METLILVMLAAMTVIMVILLVKVFSPKEQLLNQQIVDLKNQVGELTIRQLDAQNASLRRQQELFNETQGVMTRLLNSILASVNENLTRTQKNINDQLSSTGTIVGEIQKKLGSLEETTKNIQEIGKDISSLQDILQAPKLRGNLGEYLLEELLKQIFPGKNYVMQHRFKNGTRVDAVIKLGEGIVPVDSKFPLESFQRMLAAGNDEERSRFRKEFTQSVKARIDEIAQKYINPAEGTFDFAMMYIPAENVFYEVIINDSLTNREYEIFNYAIGKHVIPVSPNSFYAYLMALVYGLKGFRIEQQAKTIMGELSKVQSAFTTFYGNFTLLGGHLDKASSKYRDCLRQAEKFNDKVGQITGVKSDLLEDNSALKALPERE
jgi:DNA recombination protein RmuC